MPPFQRSVFISRRACGALCHSCSASHHCMHCGNGTLFFSPSHNLRCIVPAPQWTLARVKAECAVAAGLDGEDEEDLAFWDITNGKTSHFAPCFAAFRCFYTLQQ